MLRLVTKYIFFTPTNTWMGHMYTRLYTFVPRQLDMNEQLNSSEEMSGLIGSLAFF